MRNHVVDVYKGISIICITLLHFEDGVFNNSVNVFIGLFMIIAFYLTAGWLEGRNNRSFTLSELIKKRWRSLIVPYLWFSLIIMIFDSIMFLLGHYDIKYLATDIYKTIVFRGIGTLWFLPAIFGAEIALHLFRKLKIGNKLIMALGVLAYLIAYNDFFNFGRESDITKIVDAPFRTIANIFEGSIFICVSYYISKSSSKLKTNYFKHLLIIAIVGFVIFFSFSSIFKIESFQYKYVYILFLKFVLGFSMFSVSYFISKTFLSSLFEYWGRNSLILMVIHYSIIMELCKIAHKAIFGSEFYGISTVFYFILTIIVAYPIVHLINSKAKFLIGRL